MDYSSNYSTFPSDTGFTMYLDMTGSDLISELSIHTTFTANSTGYIDCSVTTEDVNMYIICKNIAEIVTNSSYSIAVAIAASAWAKTGIAKTVSDWNSFGKLYFKGSDFSQITASSNAVDLSVRNPINNTEFYSSTNNYN